MEALYANLSIKDLDRHREALDRAYEVAINNERDYIKSLDINDFVEVPREFLSTNSMEFGGISADLEDLGLHVKNSGKTSTKSAWLTRSNKPYVWKSKSSNKEVYNPPIPFTQSSNINDYCEYLNSKFNCKLNTCLATCYVDGSCGVRCHNDNEDNLDPTQPIVVLSLGETRKVQFFHKYQSASEKPLLDIFPTSGSLYIMRVGCQEYFRHKVPTNKAGKGVRWVLSFRCEKDVSKLHMTTSPVKDLISKFNDNNSTTQSHSPPSTHATVSKDVTQKSNKKVVVLFGTSMTKHVNGEKLARGSKTCINVFESGANIPDISRMLDNFKHTNPLSSNVSKVIFSFGTNDIQNLRYGMNKLRDPIIDLINKTKAYFPHAFILFQSCLPMKIKHENTAKNFINFNRVLLNICSSERCAFIDCFRDFVSGWDYNKRLFKDDVHLNQRGLGLLCSWLKHAINYNTFNPYVF